MSAAITVGTANSNSLTIFDPATSADAANGRLNAMLAENAEFERRRALYRDSREELDSLLMTSPQNTTQSYGTLGLFLGAFPPAAYFIRLGDYGMAEWNTSGSLLLFFFVLFMNAACAFVGYKIGQVIGQRMHRQERGPWSKMIAFSLLWALFWAAVTGFAGGAIVLIIGGFAGVIFALPVALAAFPAFAVLHRLIERGGLIERKHLLPVTMGISLSISAFILSYN